MGVDAATENPDNPPSPGDSGCDASDDGDEDEEESTSGFDHHSLDRLLEFSRIRTGKESLPLTLALTVRHKQNYESLVNSLKSHNGTKFFPTTEKELWKVLGRSGSGIESHVYCGNCGLYIGKKKHQGPLIKCPMCEVEVKKEAAKFFVTISFWDAAIGCLLR